MGPFDFYLLLLSSRKHNKKVDFITVFNGLKEFIWVCGRMIYKNLNDVAQFILLGKQRLLHSGELLDELVQTLPDCLSLYGDHLQAVGKLSMSQMNVYLDSHILFLSLERSTMITSWIFVD